jgi:hypothetical protein
MVWQRPGLIGSPGWVMSRGHDLNGLGGFGFRDRASHRGIRRRQRG